MKQERNQPCNCGSGKKYKKCCLLVEFKDREEWYKQLHTPPKLSAIEQGKIDSGMNIPIRKAPNAALFILGAMALRSMPPTMKQYDK